MKGKSLRRRRSPPLPVPRPTPLNRSPISYLSPSQFSRIQDFGSRFKKIVSEPIYKRSASDEEDFTRSIKPRRRPPPPWLAEKIYGNAQERDTEGEEDGEPGRFEEGDGGPSMGLRRRIR